MLLSVIISENNGKCFIKLNRNGKIELVDNLDLATAFHREYEDELHITLERARELFSSYLFRVVQLDMSLVSKDNILSWHFNTDL